VLKQLQCRLNFSVIAVFSLAISLSLSACQSSPSENSEKSTETFDASPTSKLLPCPVVADWPIKPITSDVLAAVTKYYEEKNLTPISVPKRQVSVLDLREQAAGEHACLNSDGGIGAYVGSVPLDATAALMVYVEHEPYPGTGAPANFVTLALLPDSGWKVVSEGTGP
jgi:hypothetical protein